MITVNKFFGRWFTDIDIRRFPDDMNIIPTNNTVNIANYSNAQMKYLPKKSVKKLLKNMLYSNKPVYLDGDDTRSSNNDNVDANRTDPNLTNRIANLKMQVYFGKGIPPRHLLTTSYLGRRKTTGSGVITKLLAKALQGVGDIIGV